MNYLTVPDGLSDRGKQFYADLVKVLDDQNLIQDLDTSILFITANTWDNYLTAVESIKTDGLTYKMGGFIKQNPAFRMMNDCQIAFRACVSELGLSPRARKMLKAITLQAGEEESPLEKFLSKEQVAN